MTGRDIIRQIVTSSIDLDADIPLFILDRNEEMSVIHRYQYKTYNIINGKIYVEKLSEKQCSYSG